MFDPLIQALAEFESTDDLYNIYAEQGDLNHAIRRDNLRRYLHEHHQRGTDTVMLMEAPGYRGCRLTGLPVTSRRVMLSGVPELNLLGTDAGYRDTTDTGFETYQNEASATIVWQTLADLEYAPLLWNTVPFHPHKKGKPTSNRTPRVSERQQAMPYLQTMLDLFQPRLIIAIGNIAHDTLSRMEIESHKVRHPSQGGKNDFVAGLNELLAD